MSDPALFWIALAAGSLVAAVLGLLAGGAIGHAVYLIRRRRAAKGRWLR